MKKYIVMLILFTLISLSGAVSDKKPGSQVGYNFGDVKLNQIDDPSSSATKVNIKDNSFKPSTLTVPVGAAVEWHNQDGVQHSVTSDTQGLFNSGVLNPGKKFVFTFSTPGSYDYHCNIHPGMQGTIIVKDTDSSSSGPGKAGSKGAGSASWSEKPISSSDLVKSANLQSETRATVVASQQLQSSPFDRPEPRPVTRSSIRPGLRPGFKHSFQSGNSAKVL